MTAPRALVFGGSGQIGRPLLQRLLERGWAISAVSRGPQTAQPRLEWLGGDLHAPPALPRAVDALFSCGPLDAFGRWYAATDIHAPRVIAFGSTSVDTKHASIDPGERDVAARLQAGESAVFEAARTRGAGATVLRPTLIYGAGRDATLTRIAQLARRIGAFPLPRHATGLRQPVHVDDLAEAAIQAIEAEASFGRAYALPGGETLAYRDMVARVLAALQPPARLVELPEPVFRLVLWAARAAGAGNGLGEAAVRRMRDDLAFDAAPAQRDLGYAPRVFAPQASMFEPPGT